ncbi:MAG: antibiotic resistance protein MarC [Ignavibacteriae bacterium]|nr:MAG: antibiotic resistance protein MarC [Ignavibacteriota bacterium]
MLEFAIIAFTSLFTMMNPLGIIPVYISLTSHMNSKEAKKVALKSVVVGFLILFLFAVAGKFIFDLFAITIDSLRIVGGIIFFIAGYDMLQARLNRIKSSNDDDFEEVKDVAISPLAIPLIAGPGAITVTIVLYNDATDISLKLVLFSVIFLILLIMLVSLLGGRQIMRFIGENGNKVLMRIMGLIVMVIAVEFVISGLTPILRQIFKIK